jgi:hypothetical protein
MTRNTLKEAQHYYGTGCTKGSTLMTRWKRMEHKGDQNVLKNGLPHPSSCSLVSCLSLNLPILIISMHGLDITTNSSLTSPLLAIDLSSFETLPNFHSTLRSHRNETNCARGRTHETELPQSRYTRAKENDLSFRNQKHLVCYG